MITTPQDWRAIALRMHAEGKYPTEISEKLGVSRGLVRLLVEPPRKRAAKAPREGEPASIPKGWNMFRAHTPRVVKRVIADRETINAAARAFACGAVDVSTLMAMITPK